MAFSPAAETADELAAALDHSEATNEPSLEVGLLEEWATRTCLDVPPDLDEDADEEVEVDDDDPQLADAKGETSERAGDGTGVDDDKPMHAVVTHRNNLWDNGQTITYAFLGPAPLCGTSRQQKKVITVLTNTPATWTDYANIKFKRLPSASASSALVRIQFIKATASWAKIGKQCKDVDSNDPTMNLGWIEDNDNLSDTERGVVLHEFGHVLGLMHEHQSPAIGGVITLKEKYVREYFKKKKGLSDKQIDEQILSPYKDSELTNYTEFDRESIMIYFMPKAMNEEGIEIPPRDSLSKFDKAFMAVHYPFFGPKPPPRPDAHITNALRVLRISPDEDEASEGDALLPVEEVTREPTEEEKAETQRLLEERQKKLENKEKIMRLYRKGDWMGIRKKMQEIYEEVREERSQVVAEMVRAMGKTPGAK